MAFIVGGRIYVKVCFSRNSDFAERIYRDILDGVIKNVSIGYQVLSYEDRIEEGQYRRYVTKWLIFEASVVSIPADPTVGIRKIEFSQNNIKETRNMNEDEKTPENEVIQESAEEVTEQTGKEPEQTEAEQLKRENEDLKKQVEDLKRLCAEPEREERNEDAEEIEKIGADFNVPQ